MTPTINVLSFFSLVLSFYRVALCNAMPELFEATRGLAPAIVIRSAPGPSLMAAALDLRGRSIVLPGSVPNSDCAHACAPIEFALSQSTCVHDPSCACGVITALSLQQCWQCAISSVRAASGSSRISSRTAAPSTITKHAARRHSTASIQPSSLAHPKEPSAEETAMKAAAVSALHDYSFACSVSGVPVTQTLELDGVAVPPLSTGSSSASTGAPSVTLEGTSSISSSSGQPSASPNSISISKPNGWFGPDSGAVALKTHPCGSLVMPTILTLLILVYRL